MILPGEFEARMQDMLGDAYPAFRDSYERDRFWALRVNPLKADMASFLRSAPFVLRPVAWEHNSCYYAEKDTPGKHPWHEAGVYYIQEPSAMAPAAYLDAQPGEHILDLCAAPGGKSTQIAAAMRGEGVLVCNEIHPARAKILSENIERMCIRNALVTNEAPAKLADIFEGYFDKILVDAPCSGEGMFRKNEEACAEWSPENVQLCADRQDEILDCAASMLRAGGRLVYSTCTFAPEEDEGSIARFLQRHSDFQVVEVPLYVGMSRGVPAWAHEAASDMHLERTIRLFPHLIDGEGHFLAVLQRDGEVPEGYHGLARYGIQQGWLPGQTNARAKGKKNTWLGTSVDFSSYLEFQQEELEVDLLSGESGGLFLFGEQLYLLSRDMPSLHTLKVLRCGLHLGTLKKNRFEPSHALALALHTDEARHSYALTMEQARAYLNGQTITLEQECPKGWYLLSIDGYSLGWGKLTGCVMKNHYPKGLRRAL